MDGINISHISHIAKIVNINIYVLNEVHWSQTQLHRARKSCAETFGAAVFG